MGNEAEVEKDEEVSAEQLEDIITSTGDIIADDEEQDGFMSAFEEPAGDLVVPEKDGDKEKDADEEVETAEKKPDTEGADESAKDTDAPEVNPLAAEMAEMQKTIRKMQGKNGELNAKLQNLSKREPEKAKPVPLTTEQFLAAIGDDKKLKELQEYDPASYAANLATAEHLESRMKQMMGDLPDNSGMRDEILSSVDQRVALGVLDVTHKGWENTVKTAEFQAMAYEGGPTEVELGVYNAVDPDKAAVMFDGFIMKYPEWGEKYGELLKSDNVSDVTKMLDLFEESKTAQAHEDKKAAKKDRLKLNVAATKSSSVQAPRKSMSEEEAMVAAFNS